MRAGNEVFGAGIDCFDWLASEFGHERRMDLDSPGSRWLP